MFANACSITCVFPYSHRRCETLTNREGTFAGNSSPPCSLAGTLIPTDQLLSLWTEEGVFLLLNDKLQDQAAIIFICKSESAIFHYRPPLLQQKIDNHPFLFIRQEMHMSPAAKKVSLAIRNDLLRSLNDSGARKKAIPLRPHHQRRRQALAVAEWSFYIYIFIRRPNLASWASYKLRISSFPFSERYIVFIYSLSCP